MFFDCTRYGYSATASVYDECWSIADEDQDPKSGSNTELDEHLRK